MTQIHLTGLLLLSNHLTEENHEAILAAARGKSRRELERMIASTSTRPEHPEPGERAGMPLGPRAVAAMSRDPYRAPRVA